MGLFRGSSAGRGESSGIRSREDRCWHLQAGSAQAPSAGAWNRAGAGVVQPRTVLPWGAGSVSGHGGLSLCDSRLLSQYGAKALDRVLSTILSQTENRVPVPKSYDRGEAAFFQGKNIPSSGVSSCLAGSFSGLRCLKSRAEREGTAPQMWGRAGGTGGSPDPQMQKLFSAVPEMKQGLISVGICCHHMKYGTVSVEKGTCPASTV